ncbi:MAG: YIP1 family protein [Desulfomonilaceae bacterium]|nr:YIP1 family protein [Desulfomonilaceae bacterium]
MAERKEIGVKCSHCGQEYEPLEGQRFCTFCGQPLHDEQSDREFASEEPASDHRSESFSSGTDHDPIHVPYTPWEDLEHLGFFQGLLQSLQQSLFSPTEFFSRLPLKGGLLNPLLYALIFQTVGNMAGYVSGMAFPNPFFSQSGLSGGAMVLIGLLIPPIVIIGVFLWTLLLQAALFLVGGANRDFEATFRIVCYSSAADLLNAVPIIGGFIALAWKTYLLIVGVREVQGISTARSAAAVFLPLILCCGVVVSGLFLALVGSAGIGG